MGNIPIRIALQQLYSNGDCLFATCVARQIKVDFPNCHLTWYIAKHCKGMILNNPDVDEIVEVDARSINEHLAWRNTELLIQELKDQGKYDYVFKSQIIGKNEKNYTGTIRSTVLKNYGSQITVSKKPYIYLTEQEISNVKEFLERYGIQNYKNIVLFECMPLSGQVPMNPIKAEEISNLALKELESTCFILTSGQKIKTENNNIFDASILSIRENAELINYCTHLVGCSSGISWLSFSSWCKTIPMFQLMDNKSFYFNSFTRDCLILGEDSSHIIETLYIDDTHLINGIISFVKNFPEAHQLFHQKLSDKSRTIYSLCRQQIVKGNTWIAVSIIKNTFFLNKTSFHYYKQILKLTIIYPLLLLLSLKRVKI